ncbi:MAG: C-terminal helicase domain-containing protein [Lachnospiraceae bacterium]|nr:C-terminal helicase domain-containing protein [Lachnospiraceae bacterium]
MNDDKKASQCWPVTTDDDKQQIYNLDECAIVSSLICQLDTESNREQSIAVIAPYRSQVNKLRKIIRSLNSRYVSIRVDTVDGFQGKESDIVIFSLTRTHGSYRFLADARRLNVALSRAKESIYMVGCLEYAKKNNLLNAVSSYCDIDFLADL